MHSHPRPTAMPITYTLDRPRQRMNTRVTGRLTFDELWEHLDAEERDRALGYAELFDARGVSTDIRTEQVRQLVERARAMQERGIVVGPTAVVADHDVMYGMARMYAMLGEFVNAPVEVFREVEPALAWLDRQPVPEPPPSPG